LAGKTTVITAEASSLTSLEETFNNTCRNTFYCSTTITLYTM
jgi:hypothetical protein